MSSDATHNNVVQVEVHAAMELLQPEVPIESQVPVEN